MNEEYSELEEHENFLKDPTMSEREIERERDSGDVTVMSYSVTSLLSHLRQTNFLCPLKVL